MKEFVAMVPASFKEDAKKIELEIMQMLLCWEKSDFTKLEFFARRACDMLFNMTCESLPNDVCNVGTLLMNDVDMFSQRIF